MLNALRYWRSLVFVWQLPGVFVKCVPKCQNNQPNAGGNDSNSPLSNISLTTGIASCSSVTGFRSFCRTLFTIFSLFFIFASP